MSRSVWLPKLVRNGDTSGMAMRRSSTRSTVHFPVPVLVMVPIRSHTRRPV